MPIRYNSYHSAKKKKKKIQNFCKDLQKKQVLLQKLTIFTKNYTIKSPLLHSLILKIVVINFYQSHNPILSKITQKPKRYRQSPTQK